jgi:ABC-type lipoprotein release transport system permease subunit
MPDLIPTNLTLLRPLAVTGLLILLLAGLGKVPFNYNLRNMVVRWRTSVVTALAFTLVIGLLVVMLAFVNGMSRLTENTGSPSNIIILAEGATDEAFSRMPVISPTSLPDEVQQCLARGEDNKQLVSAEVYVLVNQEIAHPTPGGPKRRFIQMRGIQDIGVTVQVHGMELAAGEWFTGTLHKQDVYDKDQLRKDENLHEAVFGEGVARVVGDDVFGRPLQPGDVVKVGPKWWYITGIMKSEGSTFSSEVWVRDTPIQENFGRMNTYSSYVARVKSPALATLGAKLLKVRGVQGTSLQAYSEREYYARLNRTNQQFSMAIYFVAVVMAIGGVLGVMNTMFAAISQRQRDIGVLRLLGYRRGEILVSFLLESVVIALVGGVLGCAVGSLANGLSATSVVSSTGGGGKSVVLRLAVDGNILATGLVFTVVMGFLGGLVPALSAMRLKPLESLR